MTWGNRTSIVSPLAVFLLAGGSHVGRAASPVTSAATAPAGCQIVADQFNGETAGNGKTLKIEANNIRVDPVHGLRWRVTVTNASGRTRWFRLFGLLLGQGASYQFHFNPVLGERSLGRNTTRVVREMRVLAGQSASKSLWLWPTYRGQSRAVLMVETRLGKILAFRELRLIDQSSFVFAPRYYPNTAILAVKCEGQGKSGVPAQASVRVVNAAGKSLWQRPLRDFRPLAGTEHTRYARLATPLTTGRYEVQLLGAANAGRIVARRPIYLPDLGKLLAPLPRLGDNEVSPPWTALKYHGDRVSCWNRTYTVGGTGVLGQLTSGGRNLLAAPVRFEVENVSGTWQPVAFSPPAFTTRGRGRARWEAQAEVNGVPWKMQARLAYDGLLTCDVKVAPNQPPPWKAVRLVATMPAKQARYFYTYAPGGGIPTEFVYHNQWLNHFGRLPKRGYTGSFSPFLALGSLRGALCFSAESQRDWHLRDLNRAYQITTHNGVTRLVVNFADEPLGSARARHWQFSLIAAPFEPLPRNWQTTRACTDQPPLHGVRNLSALQPPAWGWWWSPDRVDYAELRKAVANARAARARVIPGVWLQLRWGPDAGQLGAYVNSWEDDDSRVGLAPYLADWRVRIPERMFSTDSGFMELLYRLIKQMVERSQIQGVYFDTGGVWPDWNLAAGRAFVDDFGRVQPFYDIYGHRRFMQALWLLFEKTGRPFYIAELSNQVINPPTITHVTTLISGESYNGRVGFPSYIKATGSLSDWSFHYTPTIWGVPTTFIPARMHGPWDTRSLLALSLLHSTPLWVTTNCDVDLVNRVSLALVHSGVNASRFHVRVGGAWVKLDPAAKRKVYASVYAMRHTAVVVVSNLGESPQKVTVSPGAKLTQLVGEHWLTTDVLDGRSIGPAGGGVLNISVPPEDFRLLRFEAK